MTDEFKPPREPITQPAPKRELTEAELARRKANRLTKRSEQQKSSGKPSQTHPMKVGGTNSIAEADGLAPEVTDLSSEDITFAQEQHLPDLERPFLDIAPEDMADGIDVGELGLDGGNKEMILTLAPRDCGGATW